MIDGTLALVIGLACFAGAGAFAGLVGWMLLDELDDRRHEARRDSRP